MTSAAIEDRLAIGDLFTRYACALDAGGWMSSWTASRRTARW
jgi:hypothetical protein